MTDERIIKINKIGKVCYVIAKICLVFAIIGAITTGALGVSCMLSPSDIAKVNVEGTAQIEINQDYLNIGKRVIEDVDKGMTEEGQILTINDTEYEYISAETNDDVVSIQYKSLGNKLGVRNFARFFAGACVGCINDLVLLCFVIALCKAVKTCQNPFEENVIDKMKRFAIAIIPWVILQGFAKGLCDTAFNPNADFNVGFDFGKVLIVLIVVVLINVFRYGAVLQQQADETL